MTDDDDHQREIHAHRLGRRIDRLFLLECWRLRLDPDFAILALLDAIANTPITKTEELSR